MVGFIIFVVVCMGIAVLAMIGGVINDIREAENPIVKILASLGLIAAVVTNIIYLFDDSIV